MHRGLIRGHVDVREFLLETAERRGIMSLHLYTRPKWRQMCLASLGCSVENAGPSRIMYRVSPGPSSGDAARSVRSDYTLSEQHA